jgi:hypothetical protein
MKARLYAYEHASSLSHAVIRGKGGEYDALSQRVKM